MAYARLLKMEFTGYLVPGNDEQALAGGIDTIAE
jgi:hypothetical protein